MNKENVDYKEVLGIDFKEVSAKMIAINVIYKNYIVK